MNDTKRPPADAGYEEKAREMIAEGYSPEGYAAHFGHNWICFSMGEPASPIRQLTPGFSA